MSKSKRKKTHNEEHARPLPGIRDADMLVRLELRDRDPMLVGYAVTLRFWDGDVSMPVRLYDYVASHGMHHMHRYNGRKKQKPEVLNHESIQAGLNHAIAQITKSGNEMIEAWRR